MKIIEGAPPKTPVGRSKETMRTYRKWYRKYTEEGQAIINKWNSSDAAKKATKKYLSKPENKNKINTRRRDKARADECFGKLTCLECKMVYTKIEVIENNWKRVGLFHCFCGHCSV